MDNVNLKYWNFFVFLGGLILVGFFGMFLGGFFVKFFWLEMLGMIRFCVIVFLFLGFFGIVFLVGCLEI